MKRITALFLALVFTTVHALAATPTTVSQAKSQYVTKTPWSLLLGLDPTNPNNVNALIVLPDGSITVGIGALSVIGQGAQAATSGSPWYQTITRRSDGAEFGLAATPFGVQLFDAVGAAFGTTGNPIFIQNTAVAPASMRLSDGTIFYKGAEDRILATAPSAVRQTDGTVFFKAAEDRITSAAPSSNQLSDGADFYKAMDQTTGDEIVANTAAPTTGGHGSVTITTSATEIRPENLDRISLLVHNAENTVVTVGFTGVTVASGTPLSKSTLDGDGKGGNLTFQSTPAIFGIVPSGTAVLKWIEESK